LPQAVSDQPTQVAALQQVALATFEESFRSNYPEADYQAYVNQRLTLEALSSEVQDETAFFTLVVLIDPATKNETVTGYLKWHMSNRRYLPDSISCQRPLYLERFYFLKAFQGVGLGPVALQFCLSQARYAHQADYVYLTVWEKNYRAQKFYQQAGFRTLAQTIYKVGSAEDVEFVYGLKL